MSSKRALHFVFKIGDRNETIKFYRNVLGMKVLRHEEFEEGCKATCNGPFDGRWSKTMIGYGPEIDHFVVELTYNYGIKSYKPGNDFMGLVLRSDKIPSQAKKHDWSVSEESDQKVIVAPGGYKFFIQDLPVSDGSDPVQEVVLASSNLGKSLDFWNGVLEMKIYEKQNDRALLGFSDSQCKLRLQDIGQSVQREEAYGRIAFACPTAELANIQAKVKKAGHVILTPLVSLDTPGKATVSVVILADPDGHEICFVGDEAFQELSQVDPKADELLNTAMKEDFSDEWFAKQK